MIVESLLECIGNTPLINLSKMRAGTSAMIYGKAEFLNPMGSVKDRPALAMIEAGERSGKLKPGMTILEATSGNTGLGLAMAAAIKGYPIVMVIDDDIADGICKVARALGVQTISTCGFVQAMALTKQMCQEKPGHYFLAGQFQNEANPMIHQQTTAREIISDVGDRLKAFVTSYGSGGTFTGVGRALKAFNPDIRLILVEPESMRHFSGGPVICSEIHGIGPAFIPEIFEAELIDETLTISEPQAYETVKRLAAEFGILCGPSSGANVHSALRIAANMNSDDVVVTMLADRGDRYFGSDFFPED